MQILAANVTDIAPSTQDNKVGINFSESSSLDSSQEDSSLLPPAPFTKVIRDIQEEQRKPVLTKETVNVEQTDTIAPTSNMNSAPLTSIEEELVSPSDAIMPNGFNTLTSPEIVDMENADVKVSAPDQSDWSALVKDAQAYQFAEGNDEVIHAQTQPVPIVHTKKADNSDIDTSEQLTIPEQKQDLDLDLDLGQEDQGKAQAIAMDNAIEAEIETAPRLSSELLTFTQTQTKESLSTNRTDTLDQANPELERVKSAIDLERSTMTGSAMASQTRQSPSDANPQVPLERISSLSESDFKQVVQDVVQKVTASIPSQAIDAPKLAAYVSHAVDEMKQQIQAGQTPSMNLKDIVQDGLIEQGAFSKQQLQATMLAEKITQSTTQANQLISSQTLSNSAVTPSHQAPVNSVNNADFQASLTQAEVKHAQVEQGQSVKESPVNNALDKAIALTKPEGAQQVAEKLRFMQQNRQMVAEMRLDPADLGSMQIRISMQGDTAAVSFVVQNAQAREALMQDQGRLRDMLAEQGLSLGDTQVQQENAGGQSGQDDADILGDGRQTHSNSQQISAAEQSGNIIAEQRIVSGNIGGIDFYA